MNDIPRSPVVGDDVTVKGVRCRVVRFAVGATTCEYCPVESSAAPDSACFDGPLGGYRCGDERGARLVPVDMVPILFLRGELS